METSVEAKVENIIRPTEQIRMRWANVPALYWREVSGHERGRGTSKVEILTEDNKVIGTLSKSIDINMASALVMAPEHVRALLARIDKLEAALNKIGELNAADTIEARTIAHKAMEDR